MKGHLFLYIIWLYINCCLNVFQAQNNQKNGMLSLGLRSTISTFSHENTGLGTGGQFRIRLSPRVNTDWYFDYILSNDGQIRSLYYHIGWSVLYYPFQFEDKVKSIQPYILAGHCFDYNRKAIIENGLKAERFGSAVQAGIGAHYFIDQWFDISLTTQYMTHLTSSIEVNETHGIKNFQRSKHGFEGHLLITLSINYKLAKLWGSKISQ